MLSKQSSEGLTNQSINFELHDDDLQFVQEKYKSIFQRKLHCIYAHDLDGNFLEANEAALDLLGYSRQEILSVNFADLIEKDQCKSSAFQRI
jgi:PAS domain S-box-containing protein